MELLPIFIKLQGRPCLVVGGGDVATRKIELMLRAGGWITVVAPQLCPRLEQLRDEGALSHRLGVFRPQDLDGACLVVAASNDAAVNESVSHEAKSRSIAVNVVDQPGLCSFVFPAIIDRSPVVVAVSSAGSSPVLSRLIRARIETVLPAGLGRLAAALRETRERVKQCIPLPGQRMHFWEDVIQGAFSNHVLAGNEAAAIRYIEDRLQDTEQRQKGTVGSVYLIGAGPGDPDLLSFLALRLMQSADVVLYDRLVAAPILDLVRRDAERIYVGKRRDFHSVRQEEINALLLRLAQEGKRVVRLKGGDPFIFGRGGEEIAGLSAAGIPFQVVPGVTAANGCSAYAGIPLTHRDYAQSVVLVTGNLRHGKVNLDWAGLVRPQQTVVIYMGLTGLAQICAGLQAAGMRAAMPVALIERGTLPDQKVIIATLETLPQRVSEDTIHAPTLMIVGDVVRLHAQYRWLS